MKESLLTLFLLVSPYEPDVPAGATKYESAKYTQSISVLNDRDTIVAVPILSLPDTRWNQPGGLEGVTGYTTEKYRYVPEAPRRWLGNIGVRNSFGYTQQNRGLLRQYPDGTRFDEVLRNAGSGEVFEHRVRVKREGRWLSEVYYRDESEYPKGYTGLKVSCSSCHNEAGTGGYAVGLVPGGDTVLSDPLPWELWLGYSPEDRPEGKTPPATPTPTQPKLWAAPTQPTPKAAGPPVMAVPVAPPSSSRTVVKQNTVVRQGPLRRLFSGGRCR